MSEESTTPPSSASTAAEPPPIAPPTLVGRSWFYLANGERVGPVPEETLVSLLTSAHAGADLAVWTDGMAQWARADSCGPLAVAIARGAALRAGIGQARPFGAPGADSEQSSGMRMLLPVGRSAWAIAAGYAGLFCLVGIGVPFAIAFGILAIRDIKRHPEKHGLGRAWFGIGMAVLTVIVVVLAAIFRK